jgi:site-specific DNA-methyltransferase (adenine-specific)
MADYDNRIYNNSCFDMGELPDGSVHLTVTSPPYNVGKAYEEALDLPSYIDFLRNAFTEVWRVTAEGGRVCVNIANTGRNPYLPLSDYLSMIMLDTGFKMRGEIIWHKGASAGVSTAWGSWMSASNPCLRDTHEYILVFSKGAFGRGRTKEQKSTITKEEFASWTKSVWDIQADSAKKRGHPAPFPEEIPRRLVRLYTFPGDLVLDPFAGSGTTAAVSIAEGRRWAAYELNAEYIPLIEKRTKEALDRKHGFRAMWAE